MKHSLVIIGNGFDLTVGLKSSFRQFFDYYYKDLSENISYVTHLYNIYTDPKGNKFYYKNNLVTPSLIMRYLNKFDIPKAIPYPQKKDKKVYYEQNMKNLSNEFRSAIKHIFLNVENIHVNFWSLYFEIKKSEKCNDWNDVEDEIYNFLVSNKKHLTIYDIINGICCKRDKYILHESGRVISSGNTSQLRSFLNISNEKELFLGNILIYILYNNLMPNFSIDYYDHFSKENLTRKIFKYLNQQLFEFEKDLNNYLRHECLNSYLSRTGFKYNDIANIVLLYMTHKGKYDLLDFNYTNPVKETNTPSLNIHGKLQDPTNYNIHEAPVIGISHKNITLGEYAYNFTKSQRIQRLSYTNDDNNILNDDNVNKIIFFGQSFDSADLLYFYKIFDLCKILSLNTKLIFYYVPHNKKDVHAYAKQSKKITLLFKRYFLYKNPKKFSDSKVENFLQDIKSKGLLIIKNLYDILPKKIINKIRNINGYNKY